MRFTRHRQLSICARLLSALVLLLPMALQAAASFDVRVQLSNGLSGEALAGEWVVARRLNAEGGYDWYARGDTDAAGIAAFSLESGFTYTFSAKPYGQWVYSPGIRAPNQVELRAGMLPIALISGVDGMPLADTKVYLERQEPDGGFKWAASGHSDAGGRLMLEPAGLGDGAVYRLKSRSPIDGHWIFSSVIAAPGPVDFVVGNRPLVLILVDGVTGQPVPGVKVVAKEQLADGSNRWVRRLDTSQQGRAAFDLDGLGAGRRYFLQSDPYGAGSVATAVLSATGEVELRVGTSPVTLVDQRNGQPIPGIKLIAIEKTIDGKLKWRRSGITDADGAVGFDLPGVGQGRVYGIRADDVFGQGKRYYSPWIDDAGPVLFAVFPDGDHALDIKPPEVAITAPTNDASAPHLGFGVGVSAADNRAVMAVTLRVSDPLLGESEVAAELDQASATWAARIDARQVSAGQTVTITAVAEDPARNIAETSISVHVINDREPPSLTVAWPMSGEMVPASGFFASGTLVDNTGIASFTASLGMESRTIEVVPATGRWAFALPTDSLVADSRVSLTLRAEDHGGNLTEYRIGLLVGTAEAGLPHLLSRTGFGATPALLAEVRDLGWTAYLEQQLYPQDADPAVDVALADWALEKTRDLQFYQLAHAVYSRWQLRELMTWFWDNHFNTYLPKHGRKEYELAENDAFRANAMGNFRDLLAISAKSPAMLIYLDQHVSRKEDPNENYARELLELHTLGVDGGYTALDVSEVARAFTGWRVKDRAFYYDDRRHDSAEKQVLSETVPSGGGIEDGEMVLDILASHPGTAVHLCTKLARLFIADQLPADLVYDCAAVFLDSGGELRQVVESLLTSDAFVGGGFHAKVKTPLEMLAGLARGIETPQGIVDYLLHLMLANDFTALEQEIAYDVLQGDPAQPFDLRAEEADESLKRLVGTVLSFPSFQLQ